jgi:predicted phosphodiesterase
MRIGVIADIHGNLVALERVLAALARERIDRFVCLGDVAALGPRPGATLARLRDLDCPVVMGNTDAWLLAAPRADRESPLHELTSWAAAQLTNADRAFIHAFPPTLTIPLDGGSSLLCCHGSPRSYDEVIAATTPDDALDAMLIGHDAAALVVGGHTHVQLVRRHGGRHIVNVGSVGLPGTGPGTPDLPVNRGVAWAEYGLLDLSAGHIGIELRRLPLDLGEVLADGRRSGMPHFNWWRALWA